MSDDTAAVWNERHRAREVLPWNDGPAAFLAENVPLLPGHGRALDVAMGSGRNAVFLAAQGYAVTGIDISPVAVARCREEATRLGLRVEAVCADLVSYALPVRAFAVVVNFYYLQRDLCPRLTGALAPGGVLVFETFTTDQRRFGYGPTRGEHMLRPGELRTLFPGLQELLHREGIIEGERGKKAVASLVARKPA